MQQGDLLGLVGYVRCRIGPQSNDRAAAQYQNRFRMNDVIEPPIGHVDSKGHKWPSTELFKQVFQSHFASPS
jgi:hypothetical protein